MQPQQEWKSGRKTHASFLEDWKNNKKITLLLTKNNTILSMQEIHKLFLTNVHKFMKRMLQKLRNILKKVVKLEIMYYLKNKIIWKKNSQFLG